ncbi:hypothetical protein CEUSTIGMA_g7619.t1 [Chlamydomonas eustigma]|uniref:Autophagy protein 5 n=1 Tax=Chlamydomonas eustigma TaxID=1157962 RepID=A0A250XAR4_9CHLO|nr:hypothetical protein CEUSTIGMA_g7619.t1 [Chlamydomonas eustigma]|eukprot:GAX80181.1 hypothetical protein CEUSTIGMA_g7619.t1 [Chlamydomonas eustigma]
MGVENAIETKVWSNSVPLKLALAEDNITSPTRPAPFYILAPRQGFLNCVANLAWPHFQSVLPHLPGHQGLRPWFDYRQLPLKGNLPIGVLHDLLTDPGEEGALPWELTIHYTGYPEALAGWSNGLSTHVQYFHALKEACFICRGPDGAAAVMKMSGSSQDALWAAVEKADHGSLLSTWDDSFMTSRPMTALNPDGTFTTLSQVLSALLPSIRFQPPGGTKDVHAPSRSEGSGMQRSTNSDPLAFRGSHLVQSSSVRSEAESGADRKAEVDAPMLDPLSSSMPQCAIDPLEPTSAGTLLETVEPKKEAALKPITTLSAPILNLPSQYGHVLVCGITPPLASPVAWLHSHLHGPDYFLYIVILVKDCSG